MLILILTACLPPPPPVTEIGNPERTLGVAATPLPDTVPQPVVTSAWGALGEIKLVLDEQYAGSEELEWEAPELVADLTSGPVDLHFRSPNATYNRVVIRPREGRDLPPGAPPELEDGSFVVEGTRGDGVPFLLLSDTEEDVELVGSFDLDGEQTALALGFTVDRWVVEADLDTATVDGGVIRIDAGHNQSLLAAFEAELPGSMVLVEDLDGDGQATDIDAVLLD